MFDGDVTDKDIKLSDYIGKYVVFFFYPQDFTFVCPTEIIAFSERVEEFKKINCEVIGCSTDSYNCHRAWMKTPRTDGGLGDIHIPLLADPTHAVAKVKLTQMKKKSSNKFTYFSLGLQRLERGRRCSVPWPFHH